MKPAKGFYSLIQYCPDLSRLEAANIGVLLFCPERCYLQARTARGNRRIRQFFGKIGFDWDRIESFKLAIEERLEAESGNINTLEDLERFIARRGNEIQITPPRPMRVEDPKKDLDELFYDLVGGQHRKEKITGIRKYMADRFMSAGLERKLAKEIHVTVPVLNRSIEFPFGYQNGRFNLIQPARFHGTQAVQNEYTASRYAVEGRSLFEHPDPKRGRMQLVVVGDFGGKFLDAKESVGRILDANQVKLYASSELDSLIDDIRSTGKDLPQR